MSVKQEIVSASDSRQEKRSVMQTPLSRRRLFGAGAALGASLLAPSLLRNRSVNAEAAPLLPYGLDTLPANTNEVVSSKVWTAEDNTPLVQQALDTVLMQYQQAGIEDQDSVGLKVGGKIGALFLKADDNRYYEIVVRERGIYHVAEDGTLYRSLGMRDLANGKVQLDTKNEKFFNLPLAVSELLTTIMVTGEPGSQAPTLSTLRDRLTINGAENYDPDQRGQYCLQTMDKTGRVEAISQSELPTMGATIDEGDKQDPSITDNCLITGYSNGHNLTKGMQTFLADNFKSEALAIMGLPISNPYWLKVVVGGKECNVQWQAFERGTVTYTPANDPEYQYQGGLVGDFFATILEANQTNGEKEGGQPTRRELAEKAGVDLGTLIDPNAKYWQNEAWDEIAAGQFTLGINTTLMHQMMPDQGQPIDFSLPDGQIQFAKANGLAVRENALVYSLFVPDYIKNGTVTGNALKTLVMDTFIPQVITRYKGDFKEAIVVNEATLDDTDLFYKNIGPTYVVDAFRKAREMADKGTALLYNDFDCYTLADSRYKNVKTIVDSLKDEDLIDGLGLEMHIDAAKPLPSIEDLIAGIKSYGLPIYITEMDVDIRSVQGTDSERFATQANIYKHYLDAVRESGVCKSISFWGFGDNTSWLEQPEFNGSPKAEPTLYDSNLKEKPAAQVVTDELQEWAV